MSNNSAIILAGVALFSLTLAGCVSKAAVADDRANKTETCENGESCIVSGVLNYKSTVFGAFFELQPTAEEQKICVAREGVSVDSMTDFAGKTVSLSGRFEDFVEFEDCAFLEFGDSKLPCGYCGEKVFVAIDVAE